jgi:hypothetical protein
MLCSGLSDEVELDVGFVGARGSDGREVMSEFTICLREMQSACDFGTASAFFSPCFVRFLW